MTNYNRPRTPKQETASQPDNNNDTTEVLENEYADLLPFPDNSCTGEPANNISPQQAAAPPSGTQLLPPHHVLVKCHLYDNPAKCRLWDKYQILKIAEEEAAELSHNNWLEIVWLHNRVHQLENALKENGIPLPSEEEWPFEGHSVSGTGK